MLYGKPSQSGKMPIVWYYPPEIGLNGMVFITRNM
jgi:hypothetical protein